MKLFEINKTKTHIILYILGLKIKFRFVREACRKYKEFEPCLKKYRYILDYKFNEEKTDSLYSDCIWQLWLQGFENAPAIVNKCVESVKYFCPDKKIIYLDEQNISEYITIPDYIQEKYKKGIISPANYSDFIRLELLSKYGGLWIDATVLLTDKIPEEIFQSDIFFFKELGWFLTKKQWKQIRLSLQHQGLKYWESDFKYPDISTWFIYAKPNNLIIQSTKKFFADYWAKESFCKAYFMFHYWVRYSVLHDKKHSEIFKNIYNISNLFPHLIWASFFEEFKLSTFKKILTFSPIHKLTYKSYFSNKEYLDYILNLDFKEVENTFDKNNWRLNK